MSVIPAVNLAVTPKFWYPAASEKVRLKLINLTFSIEIKMYFHC